MPALRTMRDHWWWRPGWRVGRSFYTWHITFGADPNLARLVSDYAPLLAQLPVLDPVPARWLHLTMQGVGFTDEVDRHDLDRIVDRARTRCSVIQPFTLVLGPATVDPEALMLAVRPVAPLTAVRRTVRAAIGDVWGTSNVPEAADGYRPHVSLGYSNATAPAEPVDAAVAEHGEHTAQVTVEAVSLIVLNRDRKAYEWTDTATVAFGDHAGMK